MLLNSDSCLCWRSRILLSLFFLKRSWRSAFCLFFSESADLANNCMSPANFALIRSTSASSFLALAASTSAFACSLLLASIFLNSNFPSICSYLRKRSGSWPSANAAIISLIFPSYCSHSATVDKFAKACSSSASSASLCCKCPSSSFCNSSTVFL